MSPAPRQPYARPGEGGDPVTARLRLIFFSAVDEIRPNAGVELVERVYPVFRRLADAMEAEDQDELWVLSWREDGAGIAGGPAGRKKGTFKDSGAVADLRDELMEALDPVDPVTAQMKEDLRDALVAWARPYNLHRDEWVLDHAVQLLQEYRIRREMDGETEALPLGTHMGFLSYGSPSRSVVRPPRYQPELETRPEYEARVRGYMDRVEKAARDAGWQPAKWKPSAEIHLAWLAAFQVVGTSHRQIAGKTPVEERAVEMAIREAAELIGLTRRTM